MKTNKKLGIGMNVVNILKNKTSPVRSVELAEETGTSPSFMGQILHDLRTAGIVTVTRGKSGGYSFNTEFNTDGTVTAYDVAKAVGRDLTVLEPETTPVGRLNKSILGSFLDTVI